MIPDTIEIKINEHLKHTKLGIASSAIAVAVFIYFLAAGYISLYGLDALFKNSNSLGALGVLVISFFIHLAVCSVGFIVGLAFGIVSLIQTTKKRSFGIIGMALNAAPLVAAIGFIIYFFAL